MTISKVLLATPVTSAILLSGCGPTERLEEAQAKEAVGGLLTDPASAQYRDLTIHPATGSPITVCGEVNAKNRMGGYNGFQTFYVVLGTGQAEIEPDKDTVVSLTADAEPRAATAHADYVFRRSKRCPVEGQPDLTQEEATEGNRTQ